MSLVEVVLYLMAAFVVIVMFSFTVDYFTLKGGEWGCFEFNLGVWEVRLGWCFGSMGIRRVGGFISLWQMLCSWRMLHLRWDVNLINVIRTLREIPWSTAWPVSFSTRSMRSMVKCVMQHTSQTEHIMCLLPCFQPHRSPHVITILSNADMPSKQDHGFFQKLRWHFELRQHNAPIHRQFLRSNRSF